MIFGIIGAMLLSSIISAIGGLASNGMNALSQKAAQDFNREEAEKSRVFNALEAEKSRTFSAEEAEKNREFEAAQAEITRQWQTDMSNTAYQRSMVDMEKAGLNPNLLASGALGAATGNASTPQGSQAQTSAASSGAASMGAMRYNDPFSGIASALNAYATIQNRQMVAKMYNDTNMNSTIMNNSTKRYATDVTSANFQQSIWKYRKDSSYKDDNGGFTDL